VPHFVIDAPGGGGKIPLLPEYVEAITETEVVLRNYRGERFEWKQPREPALVPSGSGEPEYDLVQISRAKRSARRSARTSAKNGKRKRA
jgi:lysine 2,3-aminomutase